MAELKKGRLKIRPQFIQKVNSPEYREDLTFITLMKKIKNPASKKEASKLHDEYFTFRGNVLQRASKKRVWINYVIKNAPKKNK